MYSSLNLKFQVDALSQNNEKFSADLVNLSDLKSKFDSKVNVWDGKADVADMRKLNTLINDEVKKLEKNVDNILNKNEEMFSNLKNKNPDNNQEILSKDLVQDLSQKRNLQFWTLTFQSYLKLLKTSRNKPYWIS